MSKLDKGVAKLEEVISAMKDHDDQTSKYMRIGWNVFTYEDHEFTSCYICGHSDKAIIYELEKALKLLKATTTTPNKDSKLIEGGE